jgi:hypothetical protein
MAYIEKLILDLNDPDDQVFTDAAEKMRNDAATCVSKRWAKMICAEIVYKGFRHEVWLNRWVIYWMTKWKKTPYITLANYVKKKTLEL